MNRSLSLRLALVAGLAGRALCAQVTYLGPEFRANVTTAGAQIAPALAATPIDGRYLVGWQSFDQDGSGAGVYGRVFAADGEPLSGELRLSTSTAGDQITPALVSRYGLFKAAWASQGKDGDGFGVVLRLFDGSGTPVNGPYGNEQVVNQTTVGNQIGPRMAAADSQFVVVWSGPNPSSPSQTEVWARRYALNGQPFSNEIRANQATSGHQSQPAVGVAADGSFLVAWTSDEGDGSGYGVFARRFDAQGNPTTGDILVPTSTLFDQTTPAVTALATGGYVVAWTSYLQAVGSQIGPQPIVMAQRFDSLGGKVGAPIQVTAQSSDRQELPAVDAEASGGFLVVWQATVLASGDRQVRGRRYDAGGTALSGELPLNSTQSGDQASPAVAAQNGGRFVTAWSSFGQDGSSWGIFGQRFGTPLEPCAPDATTLCLNDGRFSVEVAWATPLGASGQGQAVPLTSDTGYFWFFGEENVEIVIKVLEACSPFGNYWVFAGGLTNVEATLVVTDTETGETHGYGNPQGTPFQPIQDAGNFHVCNHMLAPHPPSAPQVPAAWSALAQTRVPDDRSPQVPAAWGAREAAEGGLGLEPVVWRQVGEGDTSPCIAGAETLCLNQGRFEIRVVWATPQGAAGTGKAVPLTSDTGYFWFFGEENVEMVIKVLEACGINDSFWIYAGGLTDVHVRITARDSESGLVWEATNPQQTPFQPIQDVDAFPSCP